MRPRQVGRWLLAAGLLAALFEMGHDNEALFAWLTRSWQALFAALGLGGWLQDAQQSTSGEVARRSLPAVLSYAGLYLGLSLLLLRRSRGCKHQTNIPTYSAHRALYGRAN